MKMKTKAQEMHPCQGNPKIPSYVLDVQSQPSPIPCVLCLSAAWPSVSEALGDLTGPLKVRAWWEEVKSLPS